MIYGSDAELIRSIPLTRDIENPWHAVETSIGNFIIIHKHEEEEDKEDDVEGKVGVYERKKEEEEVEDEVEFQLEEEDDEVRTEEMTMREEKLKRLQEGIDGKGGSNIRRMKMTSVVS